MKEKDKYSETTRLVVYKRKDSGGGMELSMVFDKECKNVNISLMAFHCTDEPTLEPMNEWERYSSDKGQWQVETTCLGMEDIEFLYKKSEELFS